MKLLTLISLGLAARAMATMPVVDYSHIAQDAANQVVNLAKYADIATKQTATALNTLHTYENTVLQVARLGDPAMLRNIPGVSTVGELYGSYAQLLREYQQSQYLLNPGRYQQDMGYIMSRYQQPVWNGFTSASGYYVPPSQSTFQWPVAQWNVADSAQKQVDQLSQQRLRLQQQRDATLASLQATRTTAEVQKYSAVLNSLNGAIAEISHAEQELQQKTAYESQKQRAAQEIAQQAQAERAKAQELQSIDQDLGKLPTADFHKTFLLKDVLGQ
jgi:hypothetical protein